MSSSKGGLKTHEAYIKILDIGGLSGDVPQRYACHLNAYGR
jgi:hypothetical protein